jgi:hypothetical protein
MKNRVQRQATKPCEVPWLVSFCTFAGMTLIAMVITLPHPMGMLWVPLFPMGLALYGKEWFDPSNATFPRWLGIVVIVAAYAVYLALGLIFWRLRSRKFFVVACLILIFVLLLNITGCRRMLADFGSVT